ncbi:unnamed protein product, partial [Phaeothamnion confervicola]
CLVAGVSTADGGAEGGDGGGGGGGGSSGVPRLFRTDPSGAFAEWRAAAVGGGTAAVAAATTAELERRYDEMRALCGTELAEAAVSVVAAAIAARRSRGGLPCTACEIVMIETGSSGGNGGREAGKDGAAVPEGVSLLGRDAKDEAVLTENGGEEPNGGENSSVRQEMDRNATADGKKGDRGSRRRGGETAPVGRARP